MTRILLPKLFVTAWFVACFSAPAAENAEASAPDTGFLWQIGVRDNDNSEFALSPADYSRYERDGFFVVGQSETKHDWPYFQPGPADLAFGSRPHTFTIVFGLSPNSLAGECRLQVDLINTHYEQPPELEIAINDSRFRQQMPLGGDDSAYYGEPAKGQEHCFSVPFDAGLLKPGRNQIRITTLSGSMILYDWLGLEAPAGAALEAVAGTFLSDCEATPHLLIEQQDALFRPVSATIRHFGPPADLSLSVAGREIGKQTIDAGTTDAEFLVAASGAEQHLLLTFSTPDGVVAEESVTLRPARMLEIYLLPHSHVDIGYTDIQTKVEKDQWAFIEQAVAAAQQAENLPAKAQFKWNVEVLWPVEGYLKQASPESRAVFIDAVKRGQIGLDAFYCHELAGLCRPEELVQLLAFAREMRKALGVSIESAMVTDCPGLTWGAVPVLAQSGVKYLSLGPNIGHRTGHAREAWDNRPFWWVSPCGKYKVLCWQTDNAYQPIFNNQEELFAFLKASERQISAYPYDLLYYRQCKGDNQGPDPALSAFVNDWNARYASPKLVIATTAELFRAFENRYGESIPSARGDFSPYWEDGACSSARETAINRAAAERLVQAETLWALFNAGPFPKEEFRDAWRNVILYDEHTWGARSYIGSSSSFSPGTEEYDAQWRIKQAFALDAETQSHALLEKALAERRALSAPIAAVDVVNTCSWPRSDLLILPKDFPVRGDSVHDIDGNELPAQRLAAGELAVIVQNVPPFGTLRLIFEPGTARASGAAWAEGATLTNGLVQVALDETTGAIRQLRWNVLDVDLAESESAGINSYHYIAGFNPENAVSNGPVTVTIKDRGPLVASIAAESDAPGCNRLLREVRVIDGLNRVDIFNLADKKAIPLENLLKPEPQKEGFYFGFAFGVPDGVMHIDMPWSVVRPEIDQLPGSCKNWLSVQRWVDISNQDYGITWASMDAPVIEVGMMSPQPADPFAQDVWRKSIEQTTTFYSYVMNNYWTTNYRHDQEGAILFRYSVQPHRRFDAGTAARFGIERSQPLLAVPVEEDAPLLASPIGALPPGIVVTALKPIPNESAWLLRLFGASGRPEQVTLNTSNGAPLQAWIADLDGAAIEEAARPITILPFEIVTLKVERPAD